MPILLLRHIFVADDALGVSLFQISYLHLSVSDSPEGTSFTQREDNEVFQRSQGQRSRSQGQRSRSQGWRKHQVLCSMVKSDHWSVSVFSLLYVCFYALEKLDHPFHSRRSTRPNLYS